MIAAIQSIWLAASAMLFVLWLWCLFRALLALSRAARLAAETRDRPWPTLHEQWREIRRFATDPAHEATRLQLGILTLGLLAVHLMGLALWATGPP